MGCLHSSSRNGRENRDCCRVSRKGDVAVNCSNFSRNADVKMQGGLMVCRAAAGILAYMCGKGVKFSASVAIAGECLPVMLQ